MKKYLIICENRESADKVNDFIAVNSLFTEGETITEPVARLGSSYIDDERVYNAVCAYIQDGDPIRCTGWQFIGYNIAAAVVALLLCIEY